MDKSKQIVGIAKNGRIFPFGSIKKEAIDEVEVSVSNGTGTPSATAEIVGRKLILNFENLKGDVGGVAYECMTEEEYDAMEEHDPDTYYAII